MKKSKITGIIILVVTIFLYFFGTVDLCEILTMCCQRIEEENQVTTEHYLVADTYDLKLKNEEFQDTIEFQTILNHLESQDQDKIKSFFLDNEYDYYQIIQDDKNITFLFYNSLKHQVSILTKEIVLT